jgi:hypothetical protein
MEDLLNEYFKFNSNKNSNDIKIIDELNPEKLLKSNILNFIDFNLIKVINNDKLNIKFNIDYDLYNKIITDDSFFEFINSDFLKLKKVEFINEFMNNNKMPILPEHTTIIYKLNKSNKLYKLNNLDIKHDYGIFLYKFIIKNKFTKILEIGFTDSFSSLYIINALKNLELINNKTSYVAIEPIPIPTIKIKNIDKLGYKNITIIEKPDLLEEEDKFNLIFINEIYNFDYNYINLLLKNGGYIIINENKEDQVKKFELYLNLYNLSSFYNYENYEIEAWKVYKKISDDYSSSK